MACKRMNLFARKNFLPMADLRSPISDHTSSQVVLQPEIDFPIFRLLRYTVQILRRWKSTAAIPQQAVAMISNTPMSLKGNWPVWMMIAGR